MSSSRLPPLSRPPVSPAVVRGGDPERLRFALHAARMYVWERDLASDQVVRHGDPAEVLGVAVDTIEDFIASVHADDRDRVREAIEGVVRRCEPYELEFRMITGGRDRWVRDVGRRLSTARGDRFLGVCLDVTAEVEARRTAARLALHDALTGLANRTLLRERLDQTVDTLRDASASVAVLCVDLDHFKFVNDSCGHAAGDALLTQVAELLRGACRPGDTIARTGGDEFVVVLSPGGAEDVEALSRILLSRAQSGFEIDGREVFIGFSLGAAIGPQDGREAEALMRAADVALHRSKSNGRGCLSFFETGMDAQARRRQRLEQDLRTALARGELHLAYQPLVDLQSGVMTGVEALMRWTHPDEGAISPVEFIPVAESSGLILGLGEWALRTACKAAVGWPDLRVSVNVSAVQFRHRGFVALLINVLADTGLEPGRLELEVTESILLNDTDEAVSTLNAVKSLGVTLAMDDFGTGYSSLSYISRFAFDKIKIDGSFTRSLGLTAEADAIVRAVLNLGRSLRITINAEGVETREQLRFLAAEGCDQVQGYLLSPPVPPESITDRLRQRSFASAAPPVSRPVRSRRPARAACGRG